MKKKGIHKTLSIFLSISILFVLFMGIIYLLFSQIVGFLKEWEAFRTKFLELLVQLNAFLEGQYGINANFLSDLPKTMISNSGTQVFYSLINTAYSISMTFFFLIIIPIFSIFIFYYRQMLTNVLYNFFPSNKKSDIREVLTETITTIIILLKVCCWYI